MSLMKSPWLASTASRSDADKFKVRHSLMCAGRPGGGASPFPYAVAHEFGHLMMDKLFVLKRDGLPLPAQAEYQHHYHGPATAGFPENQNLMRPSATKNRGIKEPKRIWNVKDKDGYNQAADLVSNLQGLQIP